MHRGQLALKLIDYDGMFIPSLADRPSGELGHPAYQHPQRLREGTYSFEVDRFSHLAVYCAVHCLKIGRRGLWKRFNNDDNLLFRQADFSNPRKSELFRVLWGLPDRDARALVGRLALACEAPLDQVPLLNEILVKGDGKVIPLTQQQETAVKEMLSPRTIVSLASPIAMPKGADEAGGALTATPEPPPVLKDEQQIVDWMMEGANPEAEGERPILAELVEEPESNELMLPSLSSILFFLLRSIVNALVIAPVRAADRLLLALVGDENTILHNFLRLLALMALVAGLVIGFGMLVDLF